MRFKGTWCPKCGKKSAANLRRGNIEEMHKIAASRGGLCLSQVYKNIDTKLLWECSQRHQWESTPYNVKNCGYWCPNCAGHAKITIAELQEIARQNGGQCLSLTYKGGNKVRWRCQLGHEWESKPNSVKNVGHWCPQCFGNIKLTIEEMCEMADRKHGKCLSREYRGANSHLTWECVQGHTWNAKPSKIRQGQWCPYCRLKNEDECRRIIERLTCKKFPKRRPDFLDGLELDGYNPELQIGFEYQGEQHHRVIPAWHRNGEDDLAAQQARDAVKVALCQDHNVDLIVVDYDEGDKLGCIGRQLAEIHRKRYDVLVAAREWDKPILVKFTIRDNDSIWKELGS